MSGTFGCGGWAGNCGGSSDPWSENSGLGSDVQDPGRFVDDLEARQVVGNAADVVAGAGDAISFGFSAWFRRKMAGKDPRGCSAYYETGSWIGVGLSTAYGGVVGLEKAGVAGAGKEFSHWIPARLGGPRTVLNGNYVSVAEHALSDPSRYRFMPRVWKEANPLPGAVAQQLNRVPNVLAGTAIGAAWGSGSKFLAGACGN